MTAADVIRELSEIHALEVMHLRRVNKTRMPAIQRSIRTTNINRQLLALELAIKFISSERDKLDEELSRNA